ncbi:murein transglycosylase A [Nitrosomonas communis]|uniref:peptidoglycan lytic exotransglycosylase n=1 Tax=Nitrosomonas communis TaxID=44574 RepID=A0A1H2UC98_9PROT|nr:murein transglycosylase A [Nitrosomonas communis]SDW53597.1 membrane-bound lytic murein transglycosylase A [Nitrosomonas communis]
MQSQSTLSILALLLLLLVACKTETIPPAQISAKPSTSSSTSKLAPSAPIVPQVSPISPSTSQLKATDWSQLKEWEQDMLLPAWTAFLQSCNALNKQLLWRETCKKASMIKQPTDNTIKHFLKLHFTPHQVMNLDGSAEGLITGYYEPLLKGSRTPSQQYRYPLYTQPDELLIIELADVYPELKNLQLRGRLEGRKVVPYYTRAEIENESASLKGRELVWVNDQVELFFLQIQGSGRIILENGEILRVGYADQNGHPYQSIGKLLVQRGELPLENASMQGIKQWGQQNPDKLTQLLHQNSRYIFFRELPNNLSGPIGALGIPLTAGRSLAVDPRAIPQGAPVFLSTTWPNSNKPLNRLMVAQDAGSAIKGGVRADFFWGFGPEAASQAGKMKQKGKMWVLLPKNYSSQLQAQK